MAAKRTFTIPAPWALPVVRKSFLLWKPFTRIPPKCVVATTQFGCMPPGRSPELCHQDLRSWQIRFLPFVVQKLCIESASGTRAAVRRDVRIRIPHHHIRRGLRAVPPPLARLTCHPGAIVFTTNQRRRRAHAFSKADVPSCLCLLQRCRRRRLYTTKVAVPTTSVVAAVSSCLLPSVHASVPPSVHCFHHHGRLHRHRLP